MSIKKHILGAALSTAVALTFTTLAHAEGSFQPGKHWVKCYGVNACKGRSSCRLTTTTCKVLNACKGKNSCRGKGFVFKKPAECKRLGGTSPETPDALKN